MSEKMKIITALFFCCVSLQFHDEVFGGLLFVVDRFESCEQYKSAQMIFNNTNVVFVDKNYMINYDTYISKPISGLEAALNLVKCSNKENQNSCMPFYNFKIGRMCDLMEKNGPGFSSFQTCITPKYVCPLKKTVYRARNCTLDIGAVTILPLTEGFWKAELKFSDIKTKAVVGCLDVHGGIRRKY